MRLQGKRVLVTGAGAGLGKAIALAFAREGASVAVNDIDSATGEAVAEEIKNIGGGRCFVKANVASESEVHTMISTVVEELGGLDIMVNNAGIEMVKPFVEVTEDEWDKLMSVNVKGVFNGCKHAIPELEKVVAAP